MTARMSGCRPQPTAPDNGWRCRTQGKAPPARPCEFRQFVGFTTNSPLALLPGLWICFGRRGRQCGMRDRRIVAVLHRDGGGAADWRPGRQPVMRGRHWSSGAGRASPPGIVLAMKSTHVGDTSAKPEPKPRGEVASHRRLVLRSALSAAAADVAVLGGQYRAWAVRRRACAANYARLHPLERGNADPAAVRGAPRSARLADHPKERRRADPDRLRRVLRLQHDGLLRPAIHDGDQRTAAAIGWAAVRCDVDLRAVRRAVDAAAGLR